MSPFVIFTITLIVIYIVYYAVLISRDLYGKKGGSSSEEEEFEIFSSQEEEAVGVQESENGFSLVPSKQQRKVSDTQEPVSEKFAVPAHTKVDLRDDDGRITDTNIPRNTAWGNDQPVASQRDSAMSGDLANRMNSNQPQEPDLRDDNGDSTQRKIDKVQEEMDEIDPTGNLTMSKEFFREILLDANKEGSLFIKKTQVSVT